MTVDASSSSEAQRQAAAGRDHALERGGGERVTAGKDLASATVIGLFALAVMVSSLRLQVPGTLLTAPGFLPFITGLTLLLMALLLGVTAVRAGGARSLPGGAARGVRALVFDEGSRRALALIGMVIIYVLLVAWINFDLRLPTRLFVFQLSSFEVISIGMVAGLLRLYWKAGLFKCLVISSLSVEALAWVFRYGFGIVMPETF
jgi:hypothetical protein